jgi:hypothetical protein
MKEFEEAKKIFVTRTFSITHGHNLMVTQLADELTAREDKTVYESEIVRRAIDLFWQVTMKETAEQ